MFRQPHCKYRSWLWASSPEANKQERHVYVSSSKQQTQNTINLCGDLVYSEWKKEHCVWYLRHVGGLYMRRTRGNSVQDMITQAAVSHCVHARADCDGEAFLLSYGSLKQYAQTIVLNMMNKHFNMTEFYFPTHSLIKPFADGTLRVGDYAKTLNKFNIKPMFVASFYNMWARELVEAEERL